MSGKYSFYIDCVPTGWRSLVAEILSELDAFNDKWPEDNQITVLQVKEKFGSLRFYYRTPEYYRTAVLDGGDVEYVDDVYKFSTFVEQKCIASEIMCMGCGKSMLQNMLNLCEKCE